MAYTFKRDRSVQANVRHIAESQVDKALAEIDDSALGLADTVHQVRKRCKKLRGLVRLVRPCFADYAAENAAFRNAAARLSRIRDAEAMLETHDDLMAFYADEIDVAAYGEIHDRLAQRKEEFLEEKGVETRLARFRDAMSAAKTRIADWHIEEDGFAALAGGVAKTYKRAHKGLGKAEDDTTAETLHEWRKRVKYHWYHARLLSGMWPQIMKPHIAATKDLADLLGAHHDLAVLGSALPHLFDGNPDSLQTYAGLGQGRQALLEPLALNTGQKIFAEKPKALTRRWGAYWEAWQTREDDLELVRAA